MLYLNYSLYAISAGSLCLLAILLFLNITKVNVVANRWLATSYLFLAFALFQQFLDKLALPGDTAIVIHFLELTRWALAPSFYLAILYFVDPGKKSRALFAHFLPAAGFLIFSLLFITPSFFIPGFSVRLPRFLGFIFRYISVLQFVVYWILSFRLVVTHSQNIRTLSSSIESIDLLWIKRLLLGTLVLAVVRIASHGNESVSRVNPMLYCAGVFYIAFFSLRQGLIYPVTITRLPELESLIKRKNAERLSADQVQELKNGVLFVLTQKKLFLDPALTLADLSTEAGLGIHELSYVINNGFNKNFYGLINEMRVEEAKKLLLSDKIRSTDMVGIAIEAGFNSKTTFNTAFKKLTGQTPSDFAKSNTTFAV